MANRNRLFVSQGLKSSNINLPGAHRVIVTDTVLRENTSGLHWTGRRPAIHRDDAEGPLLQTATGFAFHSQLSVFCGAGSLKMAGGYPSTWPLLNAVQFSPEIADTASETTVQTPALVSIDVSEANAGDC